MSVLPVLADTGTLKTISTSSTDSVAPILAAEDQNIFAVWTEAKRSGNSDVYFSKSVDEGHAFSPPKNISNQKGGMSIVSSIAVNGTNVFVAWTEQHQDEMNSDIFFTRSTDGGETFSDPIKISVDSTKSFGPKITINDSEIMVTWSVSTSSKEYNDDMQFYFVHHGEIYFSKSTDGGETFSDPHIVIAEGYPHHPAITSIDNNIFLLWTEGPGPSTIFFSKSTDGGLLFNPPQNLSGPDDNSGFARIASDGTDIYAIWANDKVLLSKSTDLGETFSEPQNVSPSSKNPVEPSIIADEKNIFIVWTEPHARGNSIIFSKSADAGETFSEPQSISNELGFSMSPSVATNDSYVYTAWSWVEHPYDFNEILFYKSPTNQHALSSQSDQDDEKTESSDSTNKPQNYFKGTIQWDKSRYSIGDYGILKITDPDMNVDPSRIDIFSARAWSETDLQGINLDMVESGKNTSEFFIDVDFTSDITSIQRLKVSDGDLVTAEYKDTTISGSQTLNLQDTVKITPKHISPFKQLQQGKSIDEISCGEQHQLFIKNNEKPLCIKQKTYEILVQRDYF